jgi:hypothetical protein
MFSNVSPFLCSNLDEFKDERLYLKLKTFPRLNEYLKTLRINFDPVQIEWTENDDYFKSGNLLRLLLHNVAKSKPFFIGLLGKKYGTYLEKKDYNASSCFTTINDNEVDWIEKNLTTASQTGFDHIVNSNTFNNSFTEFQINLALNDENNFSFIRFYYRQIEFLDEKFNELNADDQKVALSVYEAENDYCYQKINELKMKIAKKGLVVKYYKSLEELDALIFNDYIEMIQGNYS